MTQLVVLRLEGDLSTGVEVYLEIGLEEQPPSTTIKGSLPPAADMLQVYGQWQDSYHRLGRATRIKPGITIIDHDITPEECRENAYIMGSRLNQWLSAQEFVRAKEKLYQQLHPSEDVRVLICTNSESLRRLPWQQWNLLEDYHKAEVALSATEYEQPTADNQLRNQDKVKILAILGDSTGIDVNQDKQLLEGLPNADITFLVEPQREKISDQLWEQRHDILFFAGHSRSEGETGRIYLNETESLRIDELKRGLEKAVRNGLQLAIFNSCDGLGLARALQQMRIPQLIVMREPVSDQVAQRFLKYFLTTFSKGEKLYLAERAARQRLEDLEQEFPCASLLPVIFQYRAVVPPTWNQLCGQSREGSSTAQDTRTQLTWQEFRNRRDLLIWEKQDVAEQPACPYPGMVPFSEDISHRFFGRSEEVKELIERLRLHPFVTVIGPSGSGKSSLVFAGLLPALRLSKLFGSGQWLVRTIRPGETPLTGLETALGCDPTNPGLMVAEALATQPGTQRLLLVVDQFEEVFTLVKETVTFQSALLRLVETPNCYLVLTVRADFYPELMGSPLWRQIQSHRLEVVPPNAVGLREAIIRPAKDVGVFVESALVERLVTDAAGEPGVLPLIQEALVLMWEQLEQRCLPLRAYEALVPSCKAYGASGSQKLTGLQVALARRADVALASLSEAQQAIARRIFLRLIQFGEGRADTRRQQSVDALSTVYDDKSLFKQTLHHLANSHLLTLSGEEDSNTAVDMAHEALISGWPKLQQWIGERREAEQTRRRLTAQATEWVRLGRGSGGLLDEVELAEAEGWLNSQDATALGYDEVLPALVEASGWTIQEAKRRKEEVRQRELEQERQMRELAESRQQEAEARARAEAARAQEAETRVKVQKQRTRIVVGAGCLLTILAAFALRFGIEAEQRKETAINALISEPQRLLETNNQLEALIASVKALKQLQEIGGSNTNALNKLKSVIEQVRERNRLEGHQAPVVGVSFSPDGTTIASGSADKTIKLWSISGKLLRTLPDTDQVWGVEFSPDGKMLASASNDKTVKLWNVEGKLLQPKAKRSVRILSGHENVVVAVSFSPDGKTLASSGYDGTIRIWNTATGQLLQTIKDPDVIKDRGVIYSIDYSPDGRTIASSGYYDGNVKIWNLNGKLLKIIKIPQQQKDGELDQNIVSSVKFSPNGQILAWGSYDGTIKLWRVKEGNLIKIIAAHQDQLYDIAFSSDAEMIASASRDKTVKLWQLDGTLLATLRGHSQATNQVSFRPKTNKDKPQLIASSSDDKTVRLWEFRPHNIGPPQGNACGSSGNSRAQAQLDNLLEDSCHALNGYLKTNKNVSSENQHVCDGY